MATTLPEVGSLIAELAVGFVALPLLFRLLPIWLSPFPQWGSRAAQQSPDSNPCRH